MTNKNVADHRPPGSNETNDEVGALRAGLRCGDTSCSCQSNGKVHCPAHDDQHPSLSVDEGNARPVVFRCHTGCGQREVIAALDERGLWPPRPAEPTREQGCTLGQYADAKCLPVGELRSYGLEDGEGFGGALEIPYLGEDCSEVARRRRIALTGADRFRWKPGDQPTLYGRWRLREAGERGYVVLVEGESDCHTLWHYGIPAVGVPGANSWNEAEYPALLDGIATIYVVREEDQGGDALVRSMEDSQLSERVRVIQPDGFKDPSDLHVSDPDRFLERWEVAVKSTEALPPHAQEAPRRAAATRTVEDVHEPAEVEPAALESDGHLSPVATRQDETPTEVDSADGFAAASFGLTRYVHQERTWLIWDGTRWRRDEVGRVVELAKQHAVSMAAEATLHMYWQEAAAHRRRAQSGAGIAAMLKLARSDSRLVVEPAQLDSHDYLLNFANGTLDVRTSELKEHDPANLITQLVPFDYRPDAQSPDWDEFIETVLPDPEVREYVRRVSGYSLVAGNIERIVPFIVGPTTTGKSTFGEVRRYALGGDYALTASMDTFVKGHRPGAPRPDLARMLRKRARWVWASEAEDGQQFDGSLLKWLSGNETMAWRDLYEGQQEARPSFTVWVVTNHFPRLADDDDAIWQRIRVIPFEHYIPEAERDVHLLDKLQTPEVAEAFIAWAVAGCTEWQEQGLDAPPVVTETTERYRGEMDPLRDWFDECCEPSPGKRTSIGDLYRSYEEFTGRFNTEVNKAQLGARLEAKGFPRAKRDGGTRVHLNIKLS